MPLKIIHIHTDLKFIDESAIFEGPAFENEVIILGGKGKYKGRYKETATYLKSSRSKTNWLIRHCNNADMVVLHNLCFIKSFIANRLAVHVKIAWRFFGHELYRYDLAEQHSDLTKAMLKSDQFSLSDGLEQLKNCFPALRGLRNLIKFRAIYDYEFPKAIKRADFFLWHYREEYEYFRKSWPNLPQFINLPTLNLPTLNNDSGNSNSHEKQNIIILGNSKNPLNNHFDILNIVLSSKNFNKYNFNIPFSYGMETSYSVKLREKVANQKNIILPEVFVALDDYESMFIKASAIVINTFRQKALGNILLALKNGVKVYLNRKNITLSILASQGFLVYSMDQLFDDLENDNVLLSTEEVKHNTVIMRKLAEDNSIAFFQQIIQKVITDR